MFIPFPLSPYLIFSLLFVSVSTLILFGRKLNFIFSLCTSLSLSLSLSLLSALSFCWYQNACSVKLKPMHFWLWNKFTLLMRLDLVQGSVMKTLLHLFSFMVELSTAYYSSAYMTLSSGNVAAVFNRACCFSWPFMNSLHVLKCLKESVFFLGKVLDLTSTSYDLSIWLQGLTMFFVWASSGQW